MVGGPDKEVCLPRFDRTIPLLVSEDLPAAHDFLVDAFGCEAGGGVFLLVGGLQPHLGGGIVAHHTSLSDLQSRVNTDLFVAENIVTAEMLEIAPSQAAERLQFLPG